MQRSHTCEIGNLLTAGGAGGDKHFVRLQPSRGGQLFPHLYGQLHIGAVGQYATVSVDADGNVELPEWVR